MFKWLFGKKSPKSLTKIMQDTEVKDNHVKQTTNTVYQRGVRSADDIVGRNMYSSYTPYDPTLGIMSTLSMIAEESAHSKSHHTHDTTSNYSYDSSWSSHSYDSSSSSSYDSGSSFGSSD